MAAGASYSAIPTLAGETTPQSEPSPPDSTSSSQNHTPLLLHGDGTSTPASLDETRPLQHFHHRLTSTGDNPSASENPGMGETSQNLPLDPVSLGRETSDSQQPQPQPEPSLDNTAHDTTSDTIPTAANPIPTVPLRTASVDPDTTVVRPTPIIRSSDISSQAIKHPTPDLNPKSGSCLGNIAQLEATAERLSMTSSIDVAIRELHGELKRSDSRRSRASTLANASISEDGPAEHLTRHRSQSSSIVVTNTAARHGGYSPAGFVMSPNHSLTGRLRAGSRASSGRPDIDMDSSLSRQGPGKASVRSVRSTKMSLAEIAESEPIALSQDVLDQADDAVPLALQNEAALLSDGRDLNTVFRSDAHDLSLSDHDRTPQAQETADPIEAKNDARPSSSHSAYSSTDGRDAFMDFDGVHCQPSDDDDNDYYQPQEEPPMPVPRPRVAPQGMARPQSYFDELSGQQMLYYPARVPAMLNLPSKLSSKPKAAARNQRRSQVMSAMMLEGNRQSAMMDNHRHSAMPDFNRRSSRAPAEAMRESWLPDPTAGHRDSFAALSTFDPLETGERSPLEAHKVEQPSEPVPVPEQPVELRRPQRLTQMDPEHRKSRMSRMSNIPPQLRASTFFDLPSTSPEIEVKDGSAMATLDSILDASASAPVNAFTDHAFAGTLGDEVYGKEKKRKSQGPATLLAPQEPKEPKKRSSFMWSKRDTSYSSVEKDPANVSDAGHHDTRTSIDGQSVHEDGDDKKSEEESDEEYKDAYHGPPTTLLAELQLRKQQQKQRTQHVGTTYPNGIQSTLLELDAVAETQRNKRLGKRVNLAWEDPNGIMSPDDEDDEDVPLAIIAAKNQGAKNLADLERPIGLMERREMEDNEPLSRRRARLQGQDVSMLPHRPSMMMLQTPQMAPPPPLSPSQYSPGEPLVEEVEEETLGERRKRLAALEAARNEAEGRLPSARPVSSTFSAELLSQFGDLDNAKESKPPAPDPGPEEETLGQRRRRLQAEREAREREMSYNDLTGGQEPKLTRRMSMADVLGAHPKKEDPQAAAERRRAEEQARIVRDQEARMAAMRSQMPASLSGPSLERSGGFKGGLYNGLNVRPELHAARSQPNLQGAQRTPSYGVQQYGHYGYQPSPANHYGGAMNMYGGMQQAQYPMPMASGSVDRVELWRQGVQ